MTGVEKAIIGTSKHDNWLIFTVKRLFNDPL